MSAISQPAYSASPRTILIEEISRLENQTLRSVRSGGSTFFKRSMSEYRRALGQLKRRVREAGGDDNEPVDDFDIIAEVSERYAGLFEKIHERENALDLLEEEFEEQKERAEEATFVLRTAWMNRYQNKMNAGRSLKRHHQIIVSLTGLYFAGQLSSNPEYRFNLYLEELTRHLPAMLEETASDEIDSYHFTRVYSRLFQLISGNLESSDGRSSLRTRFNDIIRKHGLVLKHLDRLGFDSRESKSVLENIRERVNLNDTF